MLLRFINLWIVAGILFGITDFVFSWNPIAAGPYLAYRTVSGTMSAFVWLNIPASVDAVV